MGGKFKGLRGGLAGNPTPTAAFLQRLLLENRTGGFACHLPIAMNSHAWDAVLSHRLVKDTSVIHHL